LEVGLGAVKRIFDLRCVVSTVWGVLVMFDFGRFTPNDDLNFRELGACDIQVLRRTRSGHLLNLQAR